TSPEMTVQTNASIGPKAAPLRRFVAASRFPERVVSAGAPVGRLWLSLGSLGDHATMPFHIRKAHKDDVPALARLHVQTFNETHRGGRPDGPFFELREQQWREAFAGNDGGWFCFVVEDDNGELVGFAKGTPHDGAVLGF